jgi:hypothetical protein
MLQAEVLLSSDLMNWAVTTMNESFFAGKRGY